jgi:single-strand DNA-binding protein
MLNKKNLVVLEGGLTRDPEEFENTNASVVHLSLAVDNAGSEKGVQYPSGYFDVKVWLSDSKYTPTALAENVKAALKDKTLRKGARVSVVGSLRHERWERDGQKNSKVVIIAESLEIYTAKPANTPAAATSASDDNEPMFVPSF